MNENENENETETSPETVEEKITRKRRNAADVISENPNKSLIRYLESKDKRIDEQRAIIDALNKELEIIKAKREPKSELDKTNISVLSSIIRDLNDFIFNKNETESDNE